MKNGQGQSILRIFNCEELKNGCVGFVQLTYPYLCLLIYHKIK